MMEGSGSVPLANESGTRSRKPKNIHEEHWLCRLQYTCRNTCVSHIISTDSLLLTTQSSTLSKFFNAFLADCSKRHSDNFCNFLRRRLLRIGLCLPLWPFNHTQDYYNAEKSTEQTQIKNTYRTWNLRNRLPWLTCLAGWKIAINLLEIQKEEYCCMLFNFGMVWYTRCFEQRKLLFMPRTVLRCRLCIFIAN